MNARWTRLNKERRAIFWPWCVVIVAGATPIILPHAYAEPVSFVSFFLGVPLLATLSLGNEFRHGTFSLWLSQPLSRMQLLGEKIAVMCPAVLSAGLISGVVMFSFTWPHMRTPYKVAAGFYVIVAIASSTLWTLATKSTPGALALISCILFFGTLFSGGVERSPGDAAAAIFSGAAVIAIISTLGVCLASLTLWLGTRKLMRLQLTGGGDSDLLMAGSVRIPKVIGDWLRIRPSGAVLNLIRKELRLLRPVWLTGLIVVIYVGFLAISRLLPAPPISDPRTVLEAVLLGLGGSICIALAGLAGILSLGEEKTSGSLAWHMSLPISSSLQWSIKLVVAMVAGLGCALIFPVVTMILGGTLHGSPLMYVDLNAVRDMLILCAILTFTCFWCACAANGTVRAVTWAPVVAAAVSLSAFGGTWLGRNVAQHTGTVKDFVVSSFHLSPTALTALTAAARGSVSWIFIPALLLGVMQSYWLFRRQSDDTFVRPLRSIVPLVAVTMLWTFCASVGLTSSQWAPFDEVGQALIKLHVDGSQNELLAEDLARSPYLSPPTRRWLEHARLTVAPSAAHSSTHLVTIHLTSGVNCKLTVIRSGATAASCGI